MILWLGIFLRRFRPSLASRKRVEFSSAPFLAHNGPRYFIDDWPEWNIHKRISSSDLFFILNEFMLSVQILVPWNSLAGVVPTIIQCLIYFPTYWVDVWMKRVALELSLFDFELLHYMLLDFVMELFVHRCDYIFLPHFLDDCFTDLVYFWLAQTNIFLFFP